MKRPEYREAGKVGSCENCSAWKDVPAPGGLGGRVCSCRCLRLSAPHLRFRKHGNSWSTRSWNGGHFSANRFTYTRAPQTPRRMATVAHSATILRTATLRFSTPQPLDWPPAGPPAALGTMTQPTRAAQTPLNYQNLRGSVQLSSRLNATRSMHPSSRRNLAKSAKCVSPPAAATCR